MGKKKRGRSWVDGGHFARRFRFRFFFPTRTFIPSFRPFPSRNTQTYAKKKGTPQRVPSGLGGGGGKAKRRTRSPKLGAVK